MQDRSIMRVAFDTVVAIDAVTKITYIKIRDEYINITEFDNPSIEATPVPEPNHFGAIVVAESDKTYFVREPWLKISKDEWTNRDGESAYWSELEKIEVIHDGYVVD